VFKNLTNFRLVNPNDVDHAVKVAIFEELSGTDKNSLCQNHVTVILSI